MSKYPEITVQLTGGDGNAFGIIGAVSKALRRGGVDAKEIEEFRKQAMSGDYDNVLETCMKWVEVE